MDLYILLGTVVVLILIIGIADFSSGTPDWWKTTGSPYSPGDGGPGGSDDDIAFQDIEETLVEVSDYTQEGQTTPVGLPVPDNTTRIDISLVWQDDIGGSNDELEMRLEVDGKALQTISSQSGRIDMQLNRPPLGNYTIFISALNCPGQVGISPVDRDNGNDWSLTATAQRRMVVE